MNRGDVHRLDVARAERGGKPGYYVVVSRNLVAQLPQLSTVMCAPIYTSRLGLDTEVFVGPEVGVDHLSAVRCDLVTLLHKEHLGRRVGQLSAAQMADLRRAILIAFDVA